MSRATSGPYRGGSSWRFPSLERDLALVGVGLAGIVLAAGAALGVIVDRLLRD